MVHSWEYGRIQQARDILKAAHDMGVTAEEVQGLCQIRYGSFMKDLTEEQLSDFRRHTLSARSKMFDHPSAPEREEEDTRSETDRSLDRWVFEGAEL